jgi:hypothetical protein
VLQANNCKVVPSVTPKEQGGGRTKKFDDYYSFIPRKSCLKLKINLEITAKHKTLFFVDIKNYILSDV